MDFLRVYRDEHDIRRRMAAKYEEMQPVFVDNDSIAPFMGAGIVKS
jgi:hypothetical protein